MPPFRRWRVSTTTASSSSAAGTSTTITFELAAVHRTSSIGRAFHGRSLILLARNTVHGTICDLCPRYCSAAGWSSSEIIERVGKVLQAGKLAHSGRNHTGEAIVGNIQLL